jgi:hypothetical protein
VKDVLPKLNILYFLILLHILPSRIVLYFPILLHILPIPIVLYFLLDNFIIFLALQVKVALPENEYLYFLSSSCVLLRVTGRTSLILQMILSFLQPFREDSALAKVQHIYFPLTLCVHPFFIVCTSQVEHPYFISSSGILPVVTVCTSCIFCWCFHYFYAIYGKLCTSQIEHFYFPSYFPLSYFYTSRLQCILPSRIVLYLVLYFPILVHILIVFIVLYFLLDKFISFLALHVKVEFLENEYLYFSSLPCVLPRVTGCTSLILWMILSFLQPFAWTLHFQNLNLSISCRHYVYFLILLFVYFLILLLCTFLNIGKAYAKQKYKKIKKLWVSVLLKI